MRGNTKALMSESEPFASRITRSMAALLSVAVRKVAIHSGKFRRPKASAIGTFRSSNCMRS